MMGVVPRVPMCEAELQRAVVETARRLGWLVLVVNKGRGKEDRWLTAFAADGKGWPDLFCVRGDRALAVEFKVGANKPSPDQRKWREALGGVPGVEAFTWWPDEWHNGTVEETLR